MKKIAVVISGLPRFCKETTDVINHVASEFKDDQVDWYFHIWNLVNDQRDRHVHESWRNLDFEKTQERLIKRLPSHHSLKGLQIDIYQNEYQDPTLMSNPSTAPLHVSSLRADRMRQWHESDNNFVYDIVIRARPDTVIFGKLNREVSPRKLLVPGVRYWGPPGRPSDVRDWFALGTSEDITLYTSLIEKVQSYRPMFVNPPMDPEVILACHLHESGITPYEDPELDIRGRYYARIENEEIIINYDGWTD